MKYNSKNIGLDLNDVEYFKIISDWEANPLIEADNGFQFNMTVACDLLTELLNDNKELNKFIKSKGYTPGDFIEFSREQYQKDKEKYSEELTINMTVSKDKEKLEQLLEENNQLQKENGELEQFNNCLIHILKLNNIKLDKYFNLNKELKGE